MFVPHCAIAECLYLTVHVLNVCTSLCLCSVAKCLGARRVSKRSFEWLSQHPVISHVVSDRDAIAACINIAGACICHCWCVYVIAGACMSLLVCVYVIAGVCTCHCWCVYMSLLVCVYVIAGVCIRHCWCVYTSLSRKRMCYTLNREFLLTPT